MMLRRNPFWTVFGLHLWLWSTMTAVSRGLVVVQGGEEEEIDDKCDHSHEHDFALTARFENESCLFEVWGVRKKANPPSGLSTAAGEYALDWRFAEAVCHYHNASLPVIDSEEKERFVVDLMAEDGACLLGMKNGKWVTGQDLTYANPDWRRLSSPNNDCFHTLLVHRDSSVFWQDVPCERAPPRASHVLVYCEESYVKNSIDPLIAIRADPPWNMNDKCDPMNEHKFRRAKKFHDRACYFEIDGADEEANVAAEKRQGLTYFTFDIELARQLCNDYGATLPVLGSQDEEKWLLEFSDQNFNYVALGLRETESSGSHVWDDGSPVTYSNADWRKGNSSSSYTLLVSSLDDPSYWMDAPVDETIPNGVQIICREEYDRIGRSTVHGSESSEPKLTTSGDSSLTTVPGPQASRISATSVVPRNDGSIVSRPSVLGVLVAVLYR